MDLPPLEFSDFDIKNPQQAAELLWKRIQQGTGDPVLRTIAAKIANARKTDSRDNRKFAAELQAWVQRNIRYLREEPETYASVTRTIDWRAGDCDDQASLLAALLRTVKIPARLTFGYWQQKGYQGKRGHVWTEALLPIAPNQRKQTWVPLETIRVVPFGWDVLAAIRKRAIPGTVQSFSYGDAPTGLIG